MEPLGLDFGGHLAAKIEPESKLKTRSGKSAKFDSRLHGGSIFEVPWGAEIDEKSMQTWLQDKTPS